MLLEGSQNKFAEKGNSNEEHRELELSHIERM